MTNEQMLSPYQNTARQFKEMEMQEIPVTMANLAIHRQREKEINQERLRAETPRICVEEHAYACHIKSSPRLSNSVTLRRGKLLSITHRRGGSASSHKTTHMRDSDITNPPSSTHRRGRNPGSKQPRMTHAEVVHA
ncbi:hypothetical protein PIB30_089942 [Stylosanthes scabra]|uniref:Uncharacterized protein n=1 Tax=Stylosanthes scabra TaxID=79078 RepID=A0ABU6VXB6_9FABA|nr:hypothetical protein [Stylosanthes scabra]